MPFGPEVAPVLVVVAAGPGVVSAVPLVVVWPFVVVAAVVVGPSVLAPSVVDVGPLIVIVSPLVVTGEKPIMTETQINLSARHQREAIGRLSPVHLMVILEQYHHLRAEES